MRERRAAYTPEERAAYLAEKRARAKRDRKDPEKRARSNAATLAGYYRAKKDPTRNARLKEGACARYRENQPWRIIQSAKLRSEKRGYAFDLTKEWLQSSWTGRCAVTGLPFVIGDARNVFSASLDRIDNAGGYTQDNCRWVLWAVNLLKHTGTDAEMFEIAKAIARSAS